MADPTPRSARVKGIPFTDVMVRAVLAGHKTQTRRLKDTYRVGDWLYIREAWCAGRTTVDGEPFHWFARRADSSREAWPDRIRNEHARVYERWSSAWRPARFMFGALARPVVLEVTDRRVELLQDISEADAKAEGSWTRPGFRDVWEDSYRHAFREAWDQINGPDSWNANPNVTAYTFKVTTP